MKKNLRYLFLLVVSLVLGMEKQQFLYQEDQRTAPQGGSQAGLLDLAVHPDYNNNGWIYFTYSSPGDADGVHGSRIGTGTGLAFYYGDIFSGWNGNLFAGSLLRQEIYRLVLEDNRVVHKETLIIGKIGRIRDIRQGPDGYIYLATDEGDGGIYRLEPVR